MAIAGAQKKGSPIRPKLASKFMVMTIPWAPNTGGGKLARGAAIIVAAFGSASMIRERPSYRQRCLPFADRFRDLGTVE